MPIGYDRNREESVYASHVQRLSQRGPIMKHFHAFIGPWRGFLVSGLISASLFFGYVLLLGLLSGCSTYRTNEDLARPAVNAPHYSSSSSWYLEPKTSTPVIVIKDGNESTIRETDKPSKRPDDSDDSDTVYSIKKSQ